ncbi:MAG: glycosyltransferase [Candidatus Omnitrophota bacterium]
MKKLILGIILVMFMVSGPVVVSYAQQRTGMYGKTTCFKTEVVLKDVMRKLWEDHAMYTRNYIISVLANLEDANIVTERLLKNQDDIGDAIKPYYGEEAGEKLSGLLRDHILIVVEVVKAAKMGNSKELDKARKKWNMNANDIATFLNGTNPNWPKKDLTDMLYKHLEFTMGEVVSRIKKDWAADIAYYDKEYDHMLMFADVLTDGIVKQFSNQFKK